MRLTLRTLLAYLDDLLEPAQAKELGAKIQESPMATELIAKIRDVIRKRRLTSPIVSGPGCDLDANTVAEYLDNTLPPDGVTELEQLCLESDVHLAEVAACHQILTLVLGEPVDISTHSRDRMYALGESSAAQQEFGASHSRHQESESIVGATGGGLNGKTSSPVVTQSASGPSPRSRHEAPRHAPTGEGVGSKAPAVGVHPSSHPPMQATTSHATTSQATTVASQSHPAPHVPLAPGPHSTSGQAASGQMTSGQALPKSPAVTSAGLSPAVKPMGSSQTTLNAGAAETPIITPSRESNSAESVDRTIPDYLKSQPIWQRAWPLALVLLLAIWGYMLVKDKDLLSGLLGKTPGTQVAATDDTTNSPAGQGVIPSGEGSETGDSASEMGEEEVAAETGSQDPSAQPDQTQTTNSEVATLDPGVDAVPPPEIGDATASTRFGPADPRRELPAEELPGEDGPELNPIAPRPGKAIAAVETETPTVPEFDPATATKPVPSIEPAPAGDSRPKPARYVSTEGVMLRYDDDRQGWFQLPHRAFVFAEDILAIPEPFEALIQFGTEKHRLTAIGPTLFQAVDTMADVPLGISVERGRIVLQTAETPVGQPVPRLKMSLTVQGLTWLLELPDAISRCGVEIIPRQPRQLEENFGSQGWSGTLFVASGTVKITTPEGKATIITGPETYVLAPDLNAGTAPQPPTDALPNWLGDRKLTSVAKLNASWLQRTLLMDDLSARDALLAAVTDRVPEKSRLATSCLGLIGDYKMMLDVLDHNEHHESREAAVEALRSWINLNPVNRELTQELLGEKFIKEHASAIYRLIWGYEEQDLRGKQVSRQLVDQLENDSLAVRELASYYIRTLTNRRLDYDARGPQSHRNAAIQQLNKLLNKDGTLLPAVPKGAGTPSRRN